MSTYKDETSLPLFKVDADTVKIVNCSGILLFDQSLIHSSYRADFDFRIFIQFLHFGLDLGKIRLRSDE